MAARTLNPDNLRDNIRRTMTDTLNGALAELPGHWPVGRRRSLPFHHRKQVAQALTDAVWPLVMDAALGIAQSVISDAPAGHSTTCGSREKPHRNDDPGGRRGVVSMGVPPPHADQGPPWTGPPVDFEG